LKTDQLYYLIILLWLYRLNLSGAYKPETPASKGFLVRQ